MPQALKKLPYKVDISILTAICLITAVEFAAAGFLSYRGGLQNSPSFGSILPFLLCELSKIVVVLLAIIRGFSHLKPDRMRCRCITTALLSIILFVGSWILRPPGAVFFLQGSEKWVRQNVDVDAIQAWLLSGEADKHLGQRYKLGRLPNDLPDFVTDFDPEFIIFHGQESEKGKCIEFTWGGLSDWGFVVGPPTMKTRQKGVIKHSKSLYEYRRPIKPGVFVFDAG